MDLKIDYIEFQSVQYSDTRKFFADAFDWSFLEFGPDYAEIRDAGVVGGVERSENPEPPLVILKTRDLEAAQAKVEAAGGTIEKEIFSFPGGRRFHFREPGGNVMAVWSEVEAEG